MPKLADILVHSKKDRVALSAVLSYEGHAHTVEQTTLHEDALLEIEPPVSGDTLRLAIIGRLHANKRFAIAIRAFRMAQRDIPAALRIVAMIPSMSYCKNWPGERLDRHHRVYRTGTRERNTVTPAGL